MIRQLFTVPENIRMAQYGHEIYGQFETLMAVNGDPAPIDFHREGYLWLGSGRRDIDSLIGNWRIQIAHDARVELLDRKGVKHRFPSMRVDDIDIAAFSPDDGYMDPHSVLMGFRRKAVSLGIRYLKDRVVDFDVGGKQVAGVRLKSGERLTTESIVNAANCWGADLCDKLGMKVSVAPIVVGSVCTVPVRPAVTACGTCILSTQFIERRACRSKSIPRSVERS